MDKSNSIIYQELDKLELNELKKIASNWNSTKATAKDKKQKNIGACWLLSKKNATHQA